MPAAPQLPLLPIPAPHNSRRATGGAMVKVNHEKLNRALASRGWNVQAFAKGCGIPHGTAHALWRRDHGSVHLVTAEKVAAKLGREVFDGWPAPKPPQQRGRFGGRPKRMGGRVSLWAPQIALDDLARLVASRTTRADGIPALQSDVLREALVLGLREMVAREAAAPTPPPAAPVPAPVAVKPPEPPATLPRGCVWNKRRKELQRRITVYLPAEQASALRTVAVERDCDQSDLIAEALRARLTP